MVQEKIQERHEKEYLVKQIRTSIYNDLKILIPVEEGFYKNITNDKFCDVYSFKMVYSPSVVLPNSDFGMFPSSLLSLIDEYQRSLANSLKVRDDYIKLLENLSTKDKLKPYFIAYYISLDSVIRYGINVIKEIDKYFPELNMLNELIPTYVSYDDFKNRMKIYLPGVEIQ